MLYSLTNPLDHHPSPPFSAPWLTPFRPKIFEVWAEGYHAQDLQEDILAGLTVGIIALPLSMALGIASEVRLCGRGVRYVIFLGGVRAHVGVDMPVSVMPFFFWSWSAGVWGVSPGEITAIHAVPLRRLSPPPLPTCSPPSLALVHARGGPVYGHLRISLTRLSSPPFTLSLPPSLQSTPAAGLFTAISAGLLISALGACPRAAFLGANPVPPPCVFSALDAPAPSPPPLRTRCVPRSAPRRFLGAPFPPVLPT